MEIFNGNECVRTLVLIEDLSHYTPFQGGLWPENLNVFFLKTPFATKIVFSALCSSPCVLAPVPRSLWPGPCVPAPVSQPLCPVPRVPAGCVPAGCVPARCVPARCVPARYVPARSVTWVVLTHRDAPEV